jgi:FkbM family methyltransferase
MNKSKKLILNGYIAILHRFSFGWGISKHWPFNKIMKQIESSFIESSIKIQDHTMFLDKNDNLGLSINPIYGESDTEFVKKIIKKNDIILDIGANIGYYTLIFAKLVGDLGKVFSFEPESENFKILKKNVEINGYNNVILEQKIVSNTNGKSTLYVSEKAGSHRIYKPDNYVESLEIECISMDNYIEKNNIKKINFIKIDVEGAELNVLQGIQKILDSNENIILFTEFSPNQIKSCGLEPTDMINFLINNKFKIYFTQIKNHKTTFLDFEKIYSLNNYENKTINLICSRSPIHNIL